MTSYTKTVTSKQEKQWQCINKCDINCNVCSVVFWTATTSDCSYSLPTAYSIWSVLYQNQTDMHLLRRATIMRADARTNLTISYKLIEAQTQQHAGSLE